MNEIEEFDKFLQSWTEDPVGAKPVLEGYRELLAGLPGITLSYKCRPGVSYSIRATGKAQTTREFFVMVDVVDDDPAARWLSICFYADVVSDPDELGDWVPQGLGGDDADCFNYDEESDAVQAYIAERLKEGAANACKDGAK